MANTILEKLYDGEIHPAEQIVPSSPEYREMADKLEQEKEYVQSKLSAADRVRFEKLCDLYSSIQIMLAYEDFSACYKLGARFMLAEFEDDKKADSNDGNE